MADPASPWTQDEYLRALWFAADAHQGQLVPGTKHSYLMHVTMVAMEVIAALRAEPQHDQPLAVTSALLHDVVEDSRVTLDELRSGFGDAVADGVAALSKNPRLPKDQQLAESLERVLRQPHEVWMVKLADRITNLQPPPPHWKPEKIARYREEAVAIHDALPPERADLCARGPLRSCRYATSPALLPFLPPPSSSASTWRRRTRLFQYGGPRPGERRGCDSRSCRPRRPAPEDEAPGSSCAGRGLASGAAPRSSHPHQRGSGRCSRVL